MLLSHSASWLPQDALDWGKKIDWDGTLCRKEEGGQGQGKYRFVPATCMYADMPPSSRIHPSSNIHLSIVKMPYK